MIVDRARRRLEAGGVAVGCFVRYEDASFAEFVALHGWDFLVFDAEHGSLDPHHLANLSRAAELRGVTPLARVPANQRHWIGRALDAGCAGVHVPSVSTIEEARAAAVASRYPPVGARGLATTRAADWALSEPLHRYTDQANRETLVIAQVETATGVDAIDRLVAVEGIDVLFLGPTDLGQSLGLTGPEGRDELQEVMVGVARTVLAADKVLGAFAADAEAMGDWISLGARYVATGVEGFIRRGMQAYMDIARDLAP